VAGSLAFDGNAGRESLCDYKVCNYGGGSSVATDLWSRFSATLAFVKRTGADGRPRALRPLVFFTRQISESRVGEETPSSHVDGKRDIERTLARGHFCRLTLAGI
jgi:hypothetical protein